jgi:hypothetical protein
VLSPIQHQILFFMAFQRIAVAGASGTLGRKILEHLLTVPGITKITAITRSTPLDESSNNPLVSFASIASYDDHEKLVTALQGHDLLVSAIAGAVAGVVDVLLVEAAVVAGVKRFMPSEYTVDVLHPHSVAFARSTILAAKIASANKMKLLAKAGKIEYTTFVTGPFLDFWLSQTVEGIVDLSNNTVMLYDGGEKQVTGSTIDFVSLCVCAVITMPQDSTRNQRIRVAETQFNGKELLKTLKEVTSKKWTGIYKTTDALVSESWEACKKGDMRGYYVGQILKLAFDGEGSCYFEEGAAFGEKNLKRLSLQDIVRHSLVTK